MVTNTKTETKKLASLFAKKLTPGSVILLYGDLGVGKTTFVQGIARGFGIKERILSPTFVLLRTHKIEGNKIKILNHVDLYRIENPIEINNLGLSERIEEKDSVMIIEWADRLKNFKPKKGYRIYLKHLVADKREITINEIS